MRRQDSRSSSKPVIEGVDGKVYHESTVSR